MNVTLRKAIYKKKYYFINTKNVEHLKIRKNYTTQRNYFNKLTGACGTDLPPPLFSNLLFTNLFSIKFHYFFIISSLFPYFKLFVSIFIQSYINIKHAI
jgi:hypothetical protein